MVRNRLKVLVSSCDDGVVAIVVGMVGTYFTSASACSASGGGLIMVWSNIPCSNA